MERCDEHPKRSIRGRGFKFKVWPKLTLAILAIFAIVIYFLPIVLTNPRMKSYIIGRIEDQTGAKVSCHELSAGWFKGVELQGISYKDPVKRIDFSADYLKVNPRISSLVRRELVLNNVVLKKANIELWVQEDHPSDIPQNKPLLEEAAIIRAGTNGFNLLAAELDVYDSQLNINLENNDQVKKLNLRIPQANLNLNQPGKQSTLKISSKINPEQGESLIEMDGAFVRPRKRWTLEKTDAQLDIQIKDVELSSLRPLFALAGIDIDAKGDLNVKINVDIQEGIAKSLTAEVDAKQIEIISTQLGSDKFTAKNLQIRTDIREDGKLYDIEELLMTSDWFEIRAQGRVPQDIAGIKALLDEKVAGDFRLGYKVDIARLINDMPTMMDVPSNISIGNGQFSGIIERKLRDHQAVTYELDSTVQNLNAAFNSKPINFEKPIKVNSTIVLNKDKEVIESLVVDSDFCQLNASGTFDSVSYDGWIDMDRASFLIAWFTDRPEFSYSGRMVYDGRTEAVDDARSIAGKFNSRSLSIQNSKGQTASQEDMLLKYNTLLSQDSFVIQTADFTTKAGTINITDSQIPLNGSDRDIQLNMKTDYQLQNLRSFLVVFRVTPAEFNLSGQLVSEILLTGRDSVYDLLAKKARINNFRFEGNHGDALTQDYIDLYLKANLNMKQKIYDVDLKLDSPNFRISYGKVEQVSKAQNNLFNANMTLDYDMQKASQFISQFIPEEFELKGIRSDTLTLTSEFPKSDSAKMLENLNGQWKTGFDSATYYGLDFEKTDINISVDDGIFNIHPFSTPVNKGKFNFAAVSDLSASPRMLKIPQPTTIVEDVEFDTETMKSILRYINPVFGDAIAGHGWMRLHCDELAVPISGGTKDDIVVAGIIEMRDVEVQSSGFLSQLLRVDSSRQKTFKIHIKPTSFELRNGQLSYDKMEIVIGDNPFVFSGKVFMNETMDMMVDLPYTLTGKTVKVGQDVKDKIRVHLEGTLKDPKIDIGKVIQENLERLMKLDPFKIFKDE